MVEKRVARRKSASPGIKQENVTKSRTPSRRRRSRPARPKPEPQAAEEPVEEVMEEGHGTDVDDAPGVKRTTKRKRESIPSKDALRASQLFCFFNDLLIELIADPACDAFLEPVLKLWTDDDVPGYREKIKKPMDLGTMTQNMREDVYIISEPGEKGVIEYSFDHKACADDIRLIFQNCMAYNDPKSEIHNTAAGLLQQLNQKILKHDKMARLKEIATKKAKRENERKRRKLAEEEAATAAASAARTAALLAKANKDAADAEKKRLEELRRKEAEWAARLEAEKKAAVAIAVQEALAQQKKENTRQSKLVNTSSVSSDEHEGVGEVTFTFVSTTGMEKKRGRKSAVVMELEARHDELMKRRKVMVEATVQLEKQKQIEMTFEEKQEICEQVAALDFIRMKEIVNIIARGMNRPDILNEVEIDLDIDNIDNVILREIQCFLNNPVAATAKGALRQVEAEIADIESNLVGIRYYKPN